MCRVVPKIDSTKISNFDIVIHRRLRIHIDSQQEGAPYIEISLTFEDGATSEKKRVALSKLESTDWSALDSQAALYPKIPLTRAKRYIADAIRSALGNFTTNDVYRLSHPGLHIINGEPVFCTGREVIQPSSSAEQRPEIECAHMAQRLDFDPDLSEADAAIAMINLISLCPDPGRIILSQVLVAFMRQAYEDAGKSPSFCVFLYGRSGSQKTTIAGFLTQAYNRSNGISELTRLNASRPSAIELLMNSVDQIVVFDDLFPADSTQVHKNQEETLFEITRYIGDGTIPARMRGNKVHTGRPKCGVLFTGEYPIGKGSDAARLLLVEMTKPNTSALTDFQKQPLIVSTFYRNFISWFIENYDKTVSYLKEWLNEYHKTDLGVHDRLRETHFFLNTAYSLLLEYYGVKGVLNEKTILQFHNSFVVMLNRLIQEQNERVSPAASAPSVQGNVLERIRELYRKRQLSIADDKQKFDDAQHDGVIHKGCLCLRPQVLDRLFLSNDRNDIVRQLEAEGALDKNKYGSTKKISAAKGKHFYWVPLSCL